MPKYEVYKEKKWSESSFDDMMGNPMVEIDKLASEAKSLAKKQEEFDKKYKIGNNPY